MGRSCRYVASSYTRVPGVGEVGWLAPNDNVASDAAGEPTPAWALGPTSAVRFEHLRRHQGKHLSKDR